MATEVDRPIDIEVLHEAVRPKSIVMVPPITSMAMALLGNGSGLFDFGHQSFCDGIDWR